MWGMKKECPLCGKGTIMARKRNLLRGKYNPTAKTRKYPNLQWSIMPDGTRGKICTSCIKKKSKPNRTSGKKSKAK
jgi:ribosomal protein L28